MLSGIITVIPEISLSVNVGISVVGNRRKRPFGENKSERIANGVMN